MADPVSWLQIEPGWSVVTSDGAGAGSVAQVEGDKQSDIFDGLAMSGGGASGLRYVPGEVVGLIYPGQVTLTIASAQLGTLQPFEAAPPETTFRPGQLPAMKRFQNWLRGDR